MSKELDATIVCAPWDMRVHSGQATRERCARCGQIVAMAKSTGEYIKTHSVVLMCVPCAMQDKQCLEMLKTQGVNCLKTPAAVKEVEDATGQSYDDCVAEVAKKVSKYLDKENEG